METAATQSPGTAGIPARTCTNDAVLTGNRTIVDAPPLNDARDCKCIVCHRDGNSIPNFTGWAFFETLNRNARAGVCIVCAPIVVQCALDSWLQDHGNTIILNASVAYHAARGEEACPYGQSPLHELRHLATRTDQSVPRLEGGVQSNG